MGAIFKQSQGWQLKQTPLTTNQNYNADKFKIEQFKMRQKVITQFLQHFKCQTWRPSKMFPFRTIDSILIHLHHIYIYSDLKTAFSEI